MKLNWKLLIAFSYLAFISGIIFLAVKSAQQKLDLVSEGYYEKAVRCQDVIDASSNAMHSDSKIVIDYLNDSKAVKITTNGIHKSLSGTLFFYKPDKAINDFSVDFKTDDNGSQILPLLNYAHGYWIVEIDWSDEGKNYHDTGKIFIQ